MSPSIKQGLMPFINLCIYFFKKINTIITYYKICSGKDVTPDYSGYIMFDFLKKAFKTDSSNKNSNVAASNTLVAPVSGKAIPLSEVPDPVFAEKMAGDGMAIIAEGDTVVAPADGELTLIFKTKHAFAMTLDNGLELLVHIGLETVSLEGEGFEQLAQQGTRVKAGTPIMKIDRNLIKSKGLSLATPVLITNVDATKSITPIATGDVVAGKTEVLKFEI
jgi:sugar PTS system EIIA component